MAVVRRVFISMPSDGWLLPQQNEFKWSVVDQVRAAGFVPEIFESPQGTPGLAANLNWNSVNCERVLRGCVGALIIGLPRWKFGNDPQCALVASEYSHYEAAVAQMLSLPTWVLAQQDLMQRVIFDRSSGFRISHFPANATAAWLKSPAFRIGFQHWCAQLNQRRDIFLGYCRQSRPTALKIRNYLKRSLGLRVLDWQDFKKGSTIMEQIEEAARSCTGGLFLFTRDDDLKSSIKTAAPRDNVVLETGYFIHAKGRDKVLIVREEGSKMPADLGGTIYLSLQDPANISPLKPALADFVNRNL